MPKYLLSRLLVASLALAISSTALAQLKPGYVRLRRIGPAVTVKQSGTENVVLSIKTPDEIPAEEVRILENNTVFTTGPDSRVILLFSNGATVTVKEDSILNIEQFRQGPFDGDYNPSTATNEPPAESRTKIFLARGELIGNVKKLNESSRFEVETPAGAAGIRGTTFRVVFRPTGTGQAFFTVTTLEGDVGVTTSEGTVAAPISVLDAEEVSIVVEVDDDTGAITVVTPVAEIAPDNADAAVLADVSAAVQESVEAVVDVVFNAANDQSDEPVAEEGGDEEGDGTASEEETEEEQPEEEAQEPDDSEQPEESAAEDTGNEEQGSGGEEGASSGEETAPTGESEGDTGGESTTPSEGGDTSGTTGSDNSGTTGGDTPGTTGGDSPTTPTTPTSPTTEAPPPVQAPPRDSPTAGSGGG